MSISNGLSAVRISQKMHAQSAAGPSRSPAQRAEADAIHKACLAGATSEVSRIAAAAVWTIVDRGGSRAEVEAAMGAITRETVHKQEEFPDGIRRVIELMARGADKQYTELQGVIKTVKQTTRNLDRATLYKLIGTIYETWAEKEKANEAKIQGYQVGKLYKDLANTYKLIGADTANLRGAAMSQSMANELSRQIIHYTSIFNTTKQQLEKTLKEIDSFFLREKDRFLRELHDQLDLLEKEPEGKEAYVAEQFGLCYERCAQKMETIRETEIEEKLEEVGALYKKLATTYRIVEADEKALKSATPPEQEKLSEEMAACGEQMEQVLKRIREIGKTFDT